MALPRSVSPESASWLEQGAETSKEDVSVIRDGLKEKKKICVSILNYTRNGKPFWNILAIQVRLFPTASAPAAPMEADVSNSQLHCVGSAVTRSLVTMKRHHRAVTF